MKYNDIILPLRWAALVIAAFLGIMALCSFDHPFDMHVHIDNLIKEAEQKVQKDQIEQIMRDDYIKIYQNDWYYENDQSSNYENYTGTYERD